MVIGTKVTAARLKHDQTREASATKVASAEIRPFRVPKTAELVADHIRKMIIRGELKPGDFLQPEAQLIERFSTSRASIREAFRILEAEQFLTITRGSRSGARVHMPDAGNPAKYAGFVLQAQGTTIADIYLVRAAIEPFAVWMLAGRRSPEDVATLRAELTQAELLQESDGAAFRTALVRFHRTIVDLTGSNSLRLMIAMVHDMLERHQVRLAASQTATMDACHGLKSFWKLINLIEAGDAERAQEHWRAHIATTNAAWISDWGDAAVVDLLD